MIFSKSSVKNKYMTEIQTLKEEIRALVHDTAYDIDKDHHAERMRIIQAKREYLQSLQAAKAQ
jgi:hypothetical protein